MISSSTSHRFVIFSFSTKAWRTTCSKSSSRKSATSIFTLRTHYISTYWVLLQSSPTTKSNNFHSILNTLFKNKKMKKLHKFRFFHATFILNQEYEKSWMNWVTVLHVSMKIDVLLLLLYPNGSYLLIATMQFHLLLNNLKALRILQKNNKK